MSLVTQRVTEDGRRLAFDLYVDASGFRSLLLEKALGSPFVSFSGSLFTDRAWVATVPREGTVRPYTTATAMDAGWCRSAPGVTITSGAATWWPGAMPKYLLP